MRIHRYRTEKGVVAYANQRTDGTFAELEGKLFSGFRETGRRAIVQQLLAPVVPTQILGVGLNYRRHAEESGAKLAPFPVLFAKGINTLQDPGGPIILPTKLLSNEVDYECELAVVIGRDCKNVSRDHALEYVIGYTCANDVSARDWQLRNCGGQWCRGKFFDTFCPLGPCLVTTDEIPDPSKLTISTRLNGIVVQDWNTGDMIYSIPELIEFLSGSTTLPAGTVILTGTPHGVGMAAKPPRWLISGDVVEIDISGIGTLRNPVIGEK
ncbi:MAG: 5-carboxymethyl-2-hydroxymuconate isomerase [Verrucomicrobiales bacterium]|nr:5-carboxymethyl-2-hydroxymuconate isomerase [Verrucomicrobiales bacterium]